MRDLQTDMDAWVKAIGAAAYLGWAVAKCKCRTLEHGNALTSKEIDALIERLP